MRHVLSFRSFLFACAICLAACVVGESATSDDRGTYVDSNGDGVTDGVDTDGDGDADVAGECATCTPGSGALCNPLVDTDGDGDVDGIDIDCDGVIDVEIPDGGGGGGSSSTCSTTVNDKTVSCTDGACECSVDGVVTSTCTAADPATAVPGNCCGF
jgi:hypothetical protein